MKRIMTLLLTAALVILCAACGESGKTPSGGEKNPTAISSPEPDSDTDDTAWKESVTAYRAFCKKELNGNEYVYYLSLLDLNFDGIPELTVYTAGGPSSNAGAVFTYEDGEVRCFTTLEMSVFSESEVSESANAVTGLLSTNYFSSPIEEAYETGFLKMYNEFLVLINKENGDKTVFLHSRSGGEFCEFGTWYQFGTKDGYLYADPLMSHRIEFDNYDVNKGKVIECKLNGADVTREEHDNAVDEMYQKMNDEYTFDKTVDYVAGTAEAADWEAFFDRAVEEGTSLLIKEAADLHKTTPEPITGLLHYIDNDVLPSEQILSSEIASEYDSDHNALSYSTDMEGNQYGPKDFVVDGDTVYILNTANSAVVLYKDGKLSSTVDLTKYATFGTLIAAKDGTLYVLGANMSILAIKADGTSEKTDIAEAIEYEEAIIDFAAFENLVYVTTSKGEFGTTYKLNLSGGKAVAEASYSGCMYDEKTAYTTKLIPEDGKSFGHSCELTVRDIETGDTKTFTLKSERTAFAATYCGKDISGNYRVKFVEIATTSDGKLACAESIQIISGDGEIIAAGNITRDIRKDYGTEKVFTNRIYQMNCFDSYVELTELSDPTADERRTSPITNVTEPTD